MCGFIRRVDDSPEVRALLVIIGLDDLVLAGGDFRPRGILRGVIIEEEGQIKSVDAI